MVIAVDIGNSSIRIGFFTGAGLLVQTLDTWPMLSGREYSLLVNAFIREKNIDKTAEGIIISSVVPSHTGVIRDFAAGLAAGEPLLVSYKVMTGLVFAIPEPGELGSDRIANAVAAYERYRGPVAVVDFGTATTISIVGRDADYIGGAIMPGIRLMSESLAKGTAKLPAVPLSTPASALGSNTIECIQSGVLYGTAGAVERILHEIEDEKGLVLKVAVTGGYGRLISGFLQRDYDFFPDLTLEGLRIIHMRNKDA
jgi:type III pantothenate kinase